MEGYLRLALLLIAASIVFLILYQSYSRQRIKPLSFSDTDALFHADKILGLDMLETIPQVHFEINEPDLGPVTVKPAPPPVPKKPPVADDFLILTVTAKANHKFASYDLVQSITATGMQYGDMNIFHYAVPSEQGSQTLFSLASATKPGDFNLDRIGDISCSGLTLFTNLPAVANPELAFELMLKTAEQLADDLDGELRADTRAIFTAETLKRYHLKVAQHQTMKQA
ncbi:MAG: cell division protein ZipA [Pseudomonadota bacterium]